jgi:hypothetical protein
MADERALLEAMRRAKLPKPAKRHRRILFLLVGLFLLGAATYVTHAHVIETAAATVG